MIIDKKKRYIECLDVISLALLIAIIIIFPLIYSGFISDDAINSLIGGTLKYSNITLVEYARQSINYWILNEGRFFPIVFYYLILFKFIQNLVVYKILITVMIILNLLAFSYFLFLITKSKNLAILGLIIPPLMFQFNAYHDPILSFHCLMQLILLLNIGSFILLFKYLNNSKFYLLIISVALYFISLLTYEISYLFFIIHFLIIYFYTKNRNKTYLLKLSFPYWLLPVAVGIFSFVLKITSGALNRGGTYVPIINGEAIITFFKQVFAALPLVYRLLDPHQIFKNINANISGETLLSIVAGIGSFILVWILIKRYVQQEKHEKLTYPIYPLFLIGIMLWILPAGLICLSPKYQSEIVWGIGYIPVYVSVFGVALIIIGVLAILLMRVKKTFWMRAIIAAVIAIIATINCSTNYYVVETLNDRWLEPRTIIEKGLQDGLFNAVPNGALLYISSRQPWDENSFYYALSGKKITIIELNPDLIEKSSYFSKDTESVYSYSSKTNVPPLYYLRYESTALNTGFCLLAKVDTMLVNGYNIEAAYGQALNLYTCSKEYRQPSSEKHSANWAYGSVPQKNFYLSGILLDETLQNSEPFVLNENQIPPIINNKEATVYGYILPDNCFDILSLNIGQSRDAIKTSTFENFKINE